MRLETTNTSFPSNLTILTATSTQKTPAGSGQYHQLANNSVALTIGTWELFPWMQTLASGGAATFSNSLFSIYGSNGADSAASPTLLSATSNLTVNSSFPSDGILYFENQVNDSRRISIGPVIVTVTATVTVYVVTFSSQTTSANARLNSGLTARRLY